MTTTKAPIDNRKVAYAAEMLRILGHPIRIRILEELEERGEMAVSMIQERVGQLQTTVSQHLLRMRSHGILATRRQGSMVFYRIAEPQVFKLLDCIRHCELD